MKEVTHEDWLKNPTSRMMWVWDDNEKEKIKRKVIYVLSGVSGKKYNVVTLHSEESCTNSYAHCAEIEKPKIRRMTNKELARWLREKPTREFKYSNSIYTYDEYCEDEEVPEDIRIREDNGEWREPLVVDHYKD